MALRKRSEKWWRLGGDRVVVVVEGAVAAMTVEGAVRAVLLLMMMAVRASHPYLAASMRGHSGDWIEIALSNSAMGLVNPLSAGVCIALCSLIPLSRITLHFLGEGLVRWGVFIFIFIYRYKLYIFIC